MPKSKSHEIKEVYARFGLAYYESEVLHRSLCSLYVVLPFQTRNDTTRLRIEERYQHAWSTTLGQIIKEFDESILSKRLLDQLKEAVQRRNFLAHRFWFQRIHLMFSKRGVDHLLEELDSAYSLFEKLDLEITSRTKERMSAIGIGEAELEEALERTLQGDDYNSLHDQRSLRKQERIVAAYDAPVNDGTQLVLETEDGELWTLSDVGLAWSTFQERDENWPHNEHLLEFLPTNIDPRPEVEKPWHYEIGLRGSTVLRVWLRGDRKYGWRVVRQDG